MVRCSLTQVKHYYLIDELFVPYSGLKPVFYDQFC